MSGLNKILHPIFPTWLIDWLMEYLSNYREGVIHLRENNHFCGISSNLSTCGIMKTHQFKDWMRLQI